MLTPKEITRIAAAAAMDRRALDVVVLELTGLSIVADYFVIASAEVDVSVRAIARAVQEKLTEAGIQPLRREGWDDARWVLLDYADVVVHVFLQPEREYYDLERLWGDAPRWRLPEGETSAAELLPAER